MKILHTADWHLGAQFGQEKRLEEFGKTLDWLAKTLEAEKIEAMLIAGDIFDTGIPPNSAVEQYYNFLLKARDAGVRQIIVIAGNHDSASFLDAPKALLKQLNIYVAGKADPEFDSLIIPLKEADGKVAAAVCAVPYLRDRDIRQAVAGEAVDQQLSRRTQAVIEYYRNITKRARELYPGLPVIATGHFYATGGRITPDAVVGSLSEVPVNQLADGIDYLALGHLHLPQTVAQRENCRYSGSLLRMSFAEIKTDPGDDDRKTLLVVDTAHPSAPPKEIRIPQFQRIEVISGTIEELEKAIMKYKAENASVWLHAINTGEFLSVLDPRLRSLCDNSQVRIVKTTNKEENPAVQVRRQSNAQPLSELDPEQVFMDLIAKQDLTDEKRAAWLEAFREAVREVEEADVNE